MGWGYYPRYVPVAERRANALRQALKLTRKGTRMSPVKIGGRTIASTFWGKAWCDNLESYSDFSNRLPRGRSYVRNGSVLDLLIEPGKVTSLVSGSSVYEITIEIRPLAEPRWKKLKTQCGSQISSLIELLQGRLSQSVMGIVTQRQSGLFPSPGEIKMSCSCPDWAGMCKHVAAALYAVGNRLDHQPEFLFKLRQVDHLELITQAGRPVAEPKRTGKKTIAASELADVFGIELEAPGVAIDSAPPAKPDRRRKSVPTKEKKASRAGKAKPKEAKPPVSVRTVHSNGGALTVVARKRAAQALKERLKWQRRRTQSSGISAVQARSKRP